METRGAALENEVAALKAEITALKTLLGQVGEKHAEYTKLLKLTQVVDGTDSDGFKYGFIEAIGSRATGMVSIKIAVTNGSYSTKSRGFYCSEFSDFEGNAYDTYSGYFSNIGSSAEFQPNQTIIGTVTFEGVKPDARIAHLVVKLYNLIDIPFHDLEIKWQ